MKPAVPGINKWMDANLYVDEEMTKAELKVSAAGDVLPNHRWANPHAFFNNMVVNYSTLYTIEKNLWREMHGKRAFPYEKYSEALLQKAFNNCVDERREAERKKIVDLVCAPPEDNVDYVEKWVAATIKNYKPEDVAVYKHFIWQVKRKLAGLDVEYHMMINILGHQGAGKSKSTRRLISPLGALVTERRLSELTDERNTYLYGIIAVILVEELAGAAQTDVDSLKANMTKFSMQARILGKNAHSNNFQNATLISTSNQSIAETVSDSTGMRRFYEVTFRDDKEACWEAQNAVDPLKVWRSVDHTKELPYIIEYGHVIAARQDGYVRQSILQSFLEANPHTILPAGQAGISIKEFWYEVRLFMDDMQKGFGFNAAKLHHELKRLTEGAVDYVTNDEGKFYNLKLHKKPLNIEGKQLA